MINKVMLIGNLGKDPEIRTLENGTKVGKFSVATNENYKDNKGEWQTNTEWHNVVVWRYLAESAERSLKKGSLVYIEGKLTHRSYKDKDGIDRYTTDVVAAIMKPLEKREGSGGYQDTGFPSEENDLTSNNNSASSANGAAPSQTNSPAEPPVPEPDDDLPF